MDELDKELDRQIQFKIEYDRIMSEAALREKGGLRPRPDPEIRPPENPSRTLRFFLDRWQSSTWR